MKTREQLALGISKDEPPLVFRLIMEIREYAPRRKWTCILAELLVTGVVHPVDCDCEDYMRDTQEHLKHAQINRRIRAAIVSEGIRAQLYKAAYREAHRPVDTEVHGDLTRRAYMVDILDFLREKPIKAWFREPTPPGQMYQGTALLDQHLTH